MSEEKSKKETPKEILFMFIGMLVFFAVQIFVPEEIKILRITGYVTSAVIIIISLIIMINKRRELNKTKQK